MYDHISMFATCVYKTDPYDKEAIWLSLNINISSIG